jgi:cell division protein FtsI/penicillin-binding protein 2
MAVQARPYPGTLRAPRESRREATPVRLRILWLLLGVLVLSTVVWGRLAYWQLVEHPRLASIADSQHSKMVVLPAARGRIFDREGKPLAVNTTVYSVFVSPEQIPPDERERVAQGLSVVLGTSKPDVMAALGSDRKFLYVSKRQSREKVDRLKTLRLPGVGVLPEQQRSYLPGANPEATLAANVLGFVNDDGSGQYGLENYWNRHLAGRAGSVSTYRDLADRDIVIGTRARHEPVDGSDLTLTLDSNIQYAAEQALAKGVRGAKAESGSVLIMDPHTGGIMAWADYPSYNANRYTDADVSRFSSPALSYLYEPGSVMKVVTLSGALDAHAITPNTTIYDPGGLSVDGFYIKDWDMRSHGTVTMTNVLELSLNVGAMRAQQMEGAANYYHYLTGFGFGQPSGVDVAGETYWPIKPLEQWKASELATASFGQGIGVNMVQMLAALNVVANGGRYAPPHVVEKVGGVARADLAQPQRQVISPDSAAQMTRMMESVVQHGSGYTARVPGFEKSEAGKTGTSQIPVNGQYSNDVWASYTGFLPADNPKFTMLVVVRKPNNGSFDHNEGYYVSGPIFREIAQSIVIQSRITPTG